MKKLLLATAALGMLATSAAAEVKIGILLGFTGPIESLTPAMAAGAELAMSEVNAAGGILGGQTVTPVRADSTCTDAAVAQAAAERLITSDGVTAMVGGDCSGITMSVLQNIAIPNGVLMISPSATSPAFSTVDSGGLFFRTAPSDAAQGRVMAEILMERGISEVAVTFTNNDYGRGLADSFEANFTAMGGTVTINTGHEDGRADYSSEVASLAAAGGEVLVVAGYVDQGGRGIVRAALDTGAFDVFMFPDGMFGDTLIETFGTEIDGSFGQHPGTDSPGADIMAQLGEANGFPGNNPFVPEAYDAAALIMLAMEKAGSTDGREFGQHIMSIANEPGEIILPGELARALEIIRAGGEINYIGASSVALIPPGESGGNYREFDIIDGQFVTRGFR